jgi:hypothetical protein
MAAVSLRHLFRRSAQAGLGFIVCAVGAGCSAAVDPSAIADAQPAARVKTALVNDADLGGLAPGSPRGDNRWSGVALPLFVRNDALGAAAR